jgi:hypothetical protein
MDSYIRYAMSSNLNTNPSTVETKEFDYTKLIPFATAGLIFLGVSKLLFYYSFFNISIISFLDFGEIITSFLNTVLVMAISIILTVGFFMGIIARKKREELSNPSNKEIKNQNNRHSYRRPRQISIIVLLLSTIILIPLYRYDWNLILPIVIWLLISFLSANYFIPICRSSTSKFVRDLSLIINILIVAESFTLFIAIQDYRNVKYDKRFLGTRIVFNNETFLKDSSHILVSDSSLFYIGKTNSYIFIHNMKEEVTSVYPMSNVLQIDLKHNSTKFR